MSAPALLQAIQGVSIISADNYNTYEQTCDTVSELRAFVGTTGMQTFVRGFAVPGDGGQAVYYWALASNPVDDGVNTIVPYGESGGCWLRAPMAGQIVPVTVFTVGSTWNLAQTDFYAKVMKTSGSATSVNVYSAPAIGQTCIVKDGKGDANNNNITIGAGSYTIDGQSNYVLTQPYESVNLTFTGSEWNVW